MSTLWNNDLVLIGFIYIGSTQEQLPLFHPTQNCDLVSLDAAVSHNNNDGWDPYNDLMALLPRTKCNATVIFEDAFLMGSMDKTTLLDHRHPSLLNEGSKSYWRAVHERVIGHVKCHSYGKRKEWEAWPKGHCEASVQGGGCVSS